MSGVAAEASPLYQVSALLPTSRLGDLPLPIASSRANASLGMLLSPPQRMKQRVEEAEAEEEARVAEDGEDWEEHFDEAQQRSYYYSPRSGATRWDRPAALGEEDGWFYRTADAQEHGPYALERMQEWFEWGHFPQGTMVRQGSAGPFGDVISVPEIC